MMSDLKIADPCTFIIPLMLTAASSNASTDVLLHPEVGAKPARKLQLDAPSAKMSRASSDSESANTSPAISA